MKYPVKSGELMSPWNALKNRINTDIDSAGARVDIQWKEEITEIASRLDAKKEVQEREKAYLTSRFYAAARDSAHFIQSAEMYIKTYLLNLNKDSLYREENGVFQNILHKKFPEMKNTLAGGTNIQSFRNSYLGDSRLIIKQILDIIFLSNRFGNRGTIGSLNTKLITDGLLKLYAGNSIYVNPLLQESMKKSFESYFKNL
jgi:hypothetical protein